MSGPGLVLAFLVFVSAVSLALILAMLVAWWVRR